MSVYRFISAEKARTPVSVCCELLGVSRSGCYDWLIGPPSERALSDAWLTEKIKEIHTARRGVYGARRVHAELRLGHGIHVGRKRVKRLMRLASLSGLVWRRRGKTTIRVAGVRVADDLVERQFGPAAPDVLWVADITYLRTWERWVYLTAVQDAYSRRIVGWSLADHMRAKARCRRAADGTQPPPAGAGVDSPLRPRQPARTQPVLVPRSLAPSFGALGLQQPVLAHQCGNGRRAHPYSPPRKSSPALSAYIVLRPNARSSLATRWRRSSASVRSVLPPKRSAPAARNCSRHLRVRLVAAQRRQHGLGLLLCGELAVLLGLAQHRLLVVERAILNSEPDRSDGPLRGRLPLNSEPRKCQRAGRVHANRHRGRA